MQSKSTRLTAYSLRNEAVIVEFTETGYVVVLDERKDPNGYSGYLHYYEGSSAESVTEAVRDQMIKYFFTHPENLPGIGATPQQKYWDGLSITDIERIGNDGKQGLYNL